MQQNVEYTRIQRSRNHCTSYVVCIVSQTEFSTEALPMDTEHAIKVIGITHVNLMENLQIALEQSVNVAQN